jgi:hypothetical protein
MIYFLQRTDGAIKIGKTNDFQRRLKQLEKNYGKLKLLGVMCGGYLEEHRVQRDFRDSCITSEGVEWFHPSSRIEQFILENTVLNFETVQSEEDARYSLRCLLGELIEREGKKRGYKLTHREISEATGMELSRISKLVTCKNVHAINGKDADILAHYFGLLSISQLYVLVVDEVVK